MTETEVIDRAIQAAKKNGLMLCNPRLSDDNPNVRTLDFWELSKVYPGQLAMSGFCYDVSRLEDQSAEMVESHMRWAIGSLKNIQAGRESGTDEDGENLAVVNAVELV